MKAIISSTYDDQYLFYLPIIVWSWNKIGVDVVSYQPGNNIFITEPRLSLISKVSYNLDLRWQAWGFFCPEHKEATYAQCVRLYAAGDWDIEDPEVLITSDVDMAVFNKDFFNQLNDGRIHVAGTDLVPDGQYPMCYIAMPAQKWREVMMIDNDTEEQTKLDQLLGHLDCEHFRGNYWAKDQEEAYNHIHLYELVKHNRAAPGTQFATRRADRDGWPTVIPPDIIDAHLPRPGYTEENFAKIMNLFQSMYPLEDFTWMHEYRDEYVKLLNAS